MRPTDVNQPAKLSDLTELFAKAARLIDDADSVII
jgi:hypothetical protein